MPADRRDRRERCGQHQLTLLLWEAGPVTERYLTTGEAARALGVHRTTLVRWIALYNLSPAETTMGGHFRWELAELRRQLEAKRVT